MHNTSAAETDNRSRDRAEAKRRDEERYEGRGEYQVGRREPVPACGKDGKGTRK